PGCLSVPLGTLCARRRNLLIRIFTRRLRGAQPGRVGGARRARPSRRARPCRRGMALLSPPLEQAPTQEGAAPARGAALSGAREAGRGLGAGGEPDAPRPRSG